MDVLESLVASPEPAIRWKAGGGSRAEVRDSELVRELVRRLLTAADANVYAKWQGAHWGLGALADLGYPPGDEALVPLRERVLATWLDEDYHRDVEVASRAAAYRHAGVPVMRGRHRAHASQQGYALWYLNTLGLADERCAQLADLLLRWQWPDGGWNCDRDPEADTSSFMETILPMRGLWRHGTPRAKEAARAAAEVFLTRRLVFGRTSRKLIRAEFGQLHYPLYWHYDVLGGLKAMMELDLLGDPRCADALDLLESMRVADGWPAHARHYRHRPTDEIAMHHDWVDWGGTSTRRANPWVTADAVAVLRAAGRIG
ncbi:hypothetical protein AB0M20_20875 [Actinoplanes sp. NPDC051633]|uniref:hypothetical protein n=1 Tax=Actinoplanes sp. NPDC051633 TaxID=3155670 RepID=UPI00342402D5